MALTEVVDYPFACPPDGGPILGCDPGLKGAIAFLYEFGAIYVEDIPIVAGEVDTDTLMSTILRRAPRFAVIELAVAMPSFPGKDGKRRGMGSASAMNFGKTYGDLRTTIRCCHVPLRVVTAGKWKNHFKLDRDKEKSRALALSLWPGCGHFSRKLDEGRAEAALIARYGLEIFK